MKSGGAVRRRDHPQKALPMNCSIEELGRGVVTMTREQKGRVLGRKRHSSRGGFGEGSERWGHPCGMVSSLSQMTIADINSRVWFTRMDKNDDQRKKKTLRGMGLRGG